MTFNFKKYFDEILFVPLGGTDEIGTNLYLYHYKGKWLIVDMGLGFAGDYFPGVEIIVPDITFLQSIRNNIVGLVITHAHEDHIGAIQYLWPEIKVPIYATKFSTAIIKTKLADVGIQNDVTLKEVGANSKFEVGPFSLEYVSLTHSVPEMQGLIIRTEKGNVFHSGDWKFDHNPLIGAHSDLEKLKKLGDEGVLAMICDSTNIFTEGRAGSEGDLKDSLRKLIATFKNEMVVVTTFASNIARLYSLMEAAKSVKRKVVLSGTSLWRMYNAAVECGYLSDVDAPIHPKQIGKLKRSETLVVATGCQGERFASIAKLARGEHPDIKLSRGDKVIFASKIIPGNDKKIFAMFNKFCKSGIDVLTEKDHFVHVSGHPCRDELEEMYKLVRPKYAIPMHGEPMHTHEHCHFVKEKKLGLPVQIENGSVALITEERTEIISKVVTGNMAIDGNFVLPSDSEILRLRRRMRDEGLAVITVNYDKKGMVNGPEVLAPGVMSLSDDIEYFDQLKSELTQFLNAANFKMLKEIESKISGITKRFFKREIGKEPKILVQLIKINS
ncbi:MAG: putative hydrolase [Candidatus Midichloriaceae bacterium]|jgi:ribonuclease J|nr:putative hydrolase [Candidatus Midichloriaceae bacterium]